MNQTIQDQSEHFVYVPKKSTINPQDIAFFLSTRLAVGAASGGDDEENNGEGSSSSSSSNTTNYGGDDAVKRLRRYESKTAELSAEFEEGMVRF